MSMAQGKELSSLDFGAMIGGPLTAVVKAQAQSALATASFIQQVGFEHDEQSGEPNGKAMNVDFEYVKPATTDAQGNPIPEQKSKLSVPILTILPIPYIQVDDVTIQFNAKLLSTTHNELLKTSQSDTKFSAKTGGFFSWYGSAQLSASYASQRTQRSGAETKDQYSLDVLVRGGQADMPAGMDKVLNILESLIVEEKASGAGGLQITPTSASAANADQITITGTGFGTSQGSGTATVDGVALTNITWSDTSITGKLATTTSTGNNKAVVVTSAGGASLSGTINVT